MPFLFLFCLFSSFVQQIADPSQTFPQCRSGACQIQTDICIGILYEHVAALQQHRRFFTQQFKRNCMPDGVKVGAVGLGPRGDWTMPSDASARIWLEEAELL